MSAIWWNFNNKIRRYKAHMKNISLDIHGIAYYLCASHTKLPNLLALLLQIPLDLCTSIYYTIVFKHTLKKEDNNNNNFFYVGAARNIGLSFDFVCSSSSLTNDLLKFASYIHDPCHSNDNHVLSQQFALPQQFRKIISAKAAMLLGLIDIILIVCMTYI